MIGNRAALKRAMSCGTASLQMALTPDPAISLLFHHRGSGRRAARGWGELLTREQPVGEVVAEAARKIERAGGRCRSA